MDLNTLLRFPTTLLTILAALLLLFVLTQLLAVRHHVRHRRHIRASGHGVLLLAGLVMSVMVGGTAMALRGYRFLGDDIPVVQIDAQILSPQRWDLLLAWPDGSARRVAVAGDAFNVEAIVLKWKLPAILVGIPPLYRLDRISGRYDDAAQEVSGPRTVIDFKPTGFADLLDLKKQYPRWLPEVDTLYGSGAYLPLVDQGHYTVSLMRTGALVARPDDATAQRIGHPLGE